MISRHVLYVLYPYIHTLAPASVSASASASPTHTTEPVRLFHRHPRPFCAQGTVL